MNIKKLIGFRKECPPEEIYGTKHTYYIPTDRNGDVLLITYAGGGDHLSFGVKNIGAYINAIEHEIVKGDRKPIAVHVITKAKFMKNIYTSVHHQFLEQEHLYNVNYEWGKVLY